MVIAIIMLLESTLIANHYYCLHLTALRHEHIYFSLWSNYCYAIRSYLNWEPLQQSVYYYGTPSWTPIFHSGPNDLWEFAVKYCEMIVYTLCISGALIYIYITVY